MPSAGAWRRSSSRASTRLTGAAFLSRAYSESSVRTTVPDGGQLLAHLGQPGHPLLYGAGALYPLRALQAPFGDQQVRLPLQQVRRDRGAGQDRLPGQAEEEAA